MSSLSFSLARSCSIFTPSAVKLALNVRPSPPSMEGNPSRLGAAAPPAPAAVPPEVQAADAAASYGIAPGGGTGRRRRGWGGTRARAASGLGAWTVAWGGRFATCRWACCGGERVGRLAFRGVLACCGLLGPERTACRLRSDWVGLGRVVVR